MLIVISNIRRAKTVFTNKYDVIISWKGCSQQAFFVKTWLSMLQMFEPAAPKQGPSQTTTPYWTGASLSQVVHSFHCQTAGEY